MRWMWTPARCLARSPRDPRMPRPCLHPEPDGKVAPARQVRAGWRMVSVEVANMDPKLLWRRWLQPFSASLGGEPVPRRRRGRPGRPGFKPYLERLENRLAPAAP